MILQIQIYTKTFLQATNNNISPPAVMGSMACSDFLPMFFLGIVGGRCWYHVQQLYYCTVALRKLYIPWCTLYLQQVKVTGGCGYELWWVVIAGGCRYETLTRKDCTHAFPKVPWQCQGASSSASILKSNKYIPACPTWRKVLSVL